VQNKVDEDGEQGGEQGDDGDVDREEGERDKQI